MAVSLVGRVLKGCLLLAVTLAVATLVCLFVIRRDLDTRALSAGAAAAGVAYLAACTAYIISARCLSCSSDPQNSRSAVTGVLLAMVIRMAVPLAALVAIPQISPFLADQGFAGMLVVNYLVALAMETYLSLSLVPKGKEIAPAQWKVIKQV